MGEKAVGCGPVGLNAEERPDFVPRREDHEGREEREHQQRHPEADVRAPGCTAPLDPGAAPGALATVRALDREGIERRVVVVEDLSLACCLGHVWIVKG